MVIINCLKHHFHLLCIYYFQRFVDCVSLSTYSFTYCNVHVQKQSQGVNCNGANIYSTIPCIRARRDTQETPPMKMSHGRSFIFEIMPEILTRNMTMLAVKKKKQYFQFSSVLTVSSGTDVFWKHLLHSRIRGRKVFFCISDDWGVNCTLNKNVKPRI